MLLVSGPVGPNGRRGPERIGGTGGAHAARSAAADASRLVVRVREHGPSTTLTVEETT
jgi:hypothetical protein